MVSLLRRGSRAAGVGALTAGVLALGGLTGPALAVVDESFDDGGSAWDSYGLDPTSTEDGTFCAEVPASDNPWDAGVVLNGVAVEEGTIYDFAFTASGDPGHTIRAVVGQDGAPYATVLDENVALSPELAEHAFTFTADLSLPATSGPEDPRGQIAFQVGGSGEAWTFCLDAVSLGGDTELLPQTSFADGAGVWDVSGETSQEVVEDALCLGVPAGGNPWSTGLTFNGLPIEEGGNYVLSFTASSDPSAGLRVLVGENAAPHRMVIEEHPVLSPEPEEHVFAFTASHTFPAESEDEPIGQLAFHLGAQAQDYTFCITDVSLVATATPPPPYSPDTGPAVRVNQHGYLPEGPKRATLVTDAEEPLAWELRDGDGQVAASGETLPHGFDPMAGLDVHVIDFTDTSLTGAGLTLAVGDEVSHPFAIGADLYQQLRYDALNYFYLARSGIDIDAAIVGEEYAREAGHVNDPERTRVPDSPNRGDYQVPCLTPEDEGSAWAYGDWSCPEGYALDVVGGWYDAGDHGKYVVNGGISVAQLMGLYERSVHAPTGDVDALGDGTLALPETGNGVPDVLDEARWQLQFLLSMQVPEGNPLAGMAHHKIHDVGWTGLPLMPAADPQERRLHRPSTAATLNLAATAAQGARLFADHEDVYPGFAGELLDAARLAWAAALENPELYAPAAAGGNGGGPYDDDEVTDEFYWAAAELYLTTGEPEFEQAVLDNPLHEADIWGPSGFTWGDTAALGRLNLATVPNDLPGRDAVRESVVEGARTYLAWQAQEPFATTYPGVDGDYEWGSNSMVVNNQVVLATAFDLTGQEEFRDGVVEAMDYLLGRNALNLSYLTGYGTVYSENQHSRWFAAQVNPALPNPPPGSLAGGPNSMRSTWDPTMQGLFGGGNDCAPAACYVDHINSWASNEITINWNAAMSWVASFLADQGDGSVAPAPAAVTVTEHPADVTVAEGAQGRFSAAASGEVLSVRWQRADADGDWVDVPDASTTELVLVASLEDDGARVRAVFTGPDGDVVTEAATMTVVPAEVAPGAAVVELSDDQVRAGDELGVTVHDVAPGEQVEIWLTSDPVLLATVEADGEGTLEVVVVVPADTQAGPHTVVALGLASGIEGSAALQVLAADDGGPGAGADGPGGLALTGASVVWLVAAIVLLLVAGGAAVAVTRARARREG
ncbi:glycoside hydrolase family 9 protein [Cellulomonas bogoriensis]|uniref:Endoglucanase n=1 Tax=Cellulomonas bogoriensis 69B4 = DSM 16987 TaxID=1386082 RepID=A0A0A0BZU9_9CELL|nr:glycoside hydrolase family 9 protein [Cellulomonas bogoriensis]KGM13202.1 glycosyl hydrolase family 5 [Cellulomonas bogoriensis 69B4 = DSM 16987]